MPLPWHVVYLTNCLTVLDARTWKLDVFRKFVISNWKSSEFKLKRLHGSVEIVGAMISRRKMSRVSFRV